MPRPPRPVLPLLLLSPCVTAPSIMKRTSAVVSSRAYKSYDLTSHAIPRTGERVVARRGMRRGGGVSGRAAGTRRARRRQVTARIATAVRRRDACGLSSVPGCLRWSFGGQLSTYTPLATALRRDEVVKG